MKGMTVTLPADLGELLSREAQRRRTSVSDVIRHLVSGSLPGPTMRPREILWAGLFEDPEMVQGRTWIRFSEIDGQMTSTAIDGETVGERRGPPGRSDTLAKLVAHVYSPVELTAWRRPC